MSKFLKKLVGIKSNETEVEEIINEEELDEYEEALAGGEEHDEETEDYKDEDAESDIKTQKNEDSWIGDEFEEGQLSIDVYQTPKNIIIKSTIAGVKPGDIDISINNDMLTIRGKREECKKIKEDDYLFRECYWGSFSRSIILPIEVKANKIDAILENGVLTITLPKTKSSKQISVKVKEK